MTKSLKNSRHNEIPSDSDEEPLAKKSVLSENERLSLKEKDEILNSSTKKKNKISTIKRKKNLVQKNLIEMFSKENPNRPKRTIKSLDKSLSTPTKSRQSLKKSPSKTLLDPIPIPKPTLIKIPTDSGICDFEFGDICLIVEFYTSFYPILGNFEKEINHVILSPFTLLSALSDREYENICLKEILAAFIGTLLLYKYKKITKLNFLNKPLYQYEITKHNVEEAFRLIIIYEKNKESSNEETTSFINECLSSQEISEYLENCKFHNLFPSTQLSVLVSIHNQLINSEFLGLQIDQNQVNVYQMWRDNNFAVKQRKEERKQTIEELKKARSNKSDDKNSTESIELIRQKIREDKMEDKRLTEKFNKDIIRAEYIAKVTNRCPTLGEDRNYNRYWHLFCCPKQIFVEIASEQERKFREDIEKLEKKKSKISSLGTLEEKKIHNRVWAYYDNIKTLKLIKLALNTRTEREKVLKQKFTHCFNEINKNRSITNFFADLKTPENENINDDDDDVVLKEIIKFDGFAKVLKSAIFDMSERLTAFALGGTALKKEHIAEIANLNDLKSTIILLKEQVYVRFFKMEYRPIELIGDEKNLLDIWTESVVNCTTLAQMHLLYFYLEGTIDWSKSNENSKCKVCRKGGQVILCDKCNAAFHLNCLRPALFSIPFGEWFCTSCKPDQSESRTRKPKYVETEDVDADIENNISLRCMRPRRSTITCSICGSSERPVNKCINCNASLHYWCNDPPFDSEMAFQKQYGCMLCNRSSSRRAITRSRGKCDLQNGKQFTKEEKQTTMKEARADRAARRAANKSYQVYKSDEDFDDNEPTILNSLKGRNSSQSPSSVESIDSYRLVDHSYQTGNKNRLATKNNNYFNSEKNYNDQDLQMNLRTKKFNTVYNEIDTDDSILSTPSIKTKIMITSNLAKNEERDYDLSEEEYNCSNNLIIEERDINDMENENIKCDSHKKERIKLKTKIVDEPTKLKQLLGLLARTGRQKNGWIFLDPVNKQDVPDYYDVIKKPVDLTTLKKNIENHKLKTVKDVAEDVAQMFINAEIYNAPDTFVFSCIEPIEKFFIKHFKTMFPNDFYSRSNIYDTPQVHYSNNCSNIKLEIGEVKFKNSNDSQNNVTKEIHAVVPLNITNSVDLKECGNEEIKPDILDLKKNNSIEVNQVIENGNEGNVLNDKHTILNKLSYDNNLVG